MASCCKISYVGFDMMIDPPFGTLPKQEMNLNEALSPKKGEIFSNIFMICILRSLDFCIKNNKTQDEPTTTSCCFFCFNVFPLVPKAGTRWAHTNVMNGVSYNPYTWPKINGFAWCYSPQKLSYGPLLITGFWGPPCRGPTGCFCGAFPSRSDFVQIQISGAMPVPKSSEPESSPGSLDRQVSHGKHGKTQGFGHLKTQGYSP